MSLKSLQAKLNKRIAIKLKNRKNWVNSFLCEYQDKKPKKPIEEQCAHAIIKIPKYKNINKAKFIKKGLK